MSYPLHICFFNRSYWPDMAATGQYLTELAQDLVSEHQCEVTVVAGQPLTVAARASWALSTSEIHNGVRVIRANGTHFRPRRFAGRAANYLTYFASAALASLRVRQPDVVVALTDPPIIGLMALAAARRAGARFVFRCTDIFPEVASLLEDFHSDRVDRVLDRINRYLIAHADLTIAIGSRMKRRLVEEKGADGTNLPIIHDWADCQAITPGPRDNPFSREHGLVDKFVVMHSGNVGASQNLDMLIDAAERLREREDIVFAIVGDGIRRARLESSASARGLTNVRFFPYQPKERLDQSFSAADVFVVSLRPGLEGYIVPSKIYGTLAAGRPFVAAVDESCEVAEIAREHSCGLVAPPGDVQALVTSVLKLRDDAELRLAMGQRARDTAWRFDRRRAVAAYYDVLAQLARAAPGTQHPARSTRHAAPGTQHPARRRST